MTAGNGISLTDVVLSAEETITGESFHLYQIFRMNEPQARMERVNTIIHHILKINYTFTFRSEGDIKSGYKKWKYFSDQCLVGSPKYWTPCIVLFEQYWVNIPRGASSAWLSFLGLRFICILLSLRFFLGGEWLPIFILIFFCTLSRTTPLRNELQLFIK